MDWRQTMIAHNKQTIERLSEGVKMIESGRVQFRSMVDGQWVVTNDSILERDRHVIGVLTEQNERLAKGED